MKFDQEGTLNQISVPLLNGQCFDITIEERPEGMSDDELLVVVQRFLSLNEQAQHHLAEHLFAYYKDTEDAIGPEQILEDMDQLLETPSQTLEYIEIHNVCIDYGFMEDAPFIVLDGECAWEPEHGVMISYQHGDVLMRVGPFGHISNASATGQLEDNRYIYMAPHEAASSFASSSS